MAPFAFQHRTQRALILLGLTAAYFLAGKLGLSFAHVHQSASAVWPPTGIALGSLLIFGRWVWPAIFAGAFLVNVTTSGEVTVSVGIACGNTLEGLIGAWLVQRYAGGLACFERPADIFRFAALAAVAATTISASIGVASLYAGQLAETSALGAIWLTWWLGDAVGALVVAPLLVLWFTKPAVDWPAERAAEATLVFIAVAAVATLVFVVLRKPLAFLTLPALAWAAFRFGPREVATALGLQAVLAVYGTLRESGPFAVGSVHEALLVLQAFMGTLAMTLLPIAALVGERRRALQQADAANRAKDEFIATLSHELRNPLQAISNAVQLVREPAEHGAAAVQIIRRQTEHLARLVNDLLDVTRVIAGKAVLVRRHIDLDVAVRNSVTMLDVAGRCRDHRLDLRSSSVWVDADPERMDQVIVNLLTNALKYTPAGGHIRVEVTRQGRDAVLRVADDGIGIPPDLLPRVFDPFTQGAHGLERSAGGLGIGLTLARRLVEQHGGSIRAHSEGAGRGSTFEVRLPAAASLALAVRSEAPRAVPAERRRVLIVEDNADARESLRRLLQGLGHEVSVAADGPRAIEVALREAPDIALVDIGLPGLDGYAVARELRGRGLRLRLCAITGYGAAEDRQRSREAGFDEHLVKPVALAELQRILA